MTDYKIKCYSKTDIIVLKEIAAENLGFVKLVKKVPYKYAEYSVHSLNKKYIPTIYFEFLRYKKSLKKKKK